ncbi:MAG: zinc ribbon domain-containing protein [Euryarchaeota archaeon]|nr:zinc ribbon domain-containing protein [Euryarchaeota archaeon]
MEETEEIGEAGGAACAACGADLAEGAAECQSCGEKAPTEAEPNKCPKCEAELPLDTTECPGCGTKVEPKYRPGHVCPVCGSDKYTPESGDLVKCNECGNVYVRADDEEGILKGWKWKFWLGLAFIAIGDFGFALASYLHNVARWSPIGDMYLGYGWLDTLLGAVGITLFALGVVLFGWAFRREKTVECPSCGEVIFEHELKVEEEREADKDEIDKALEEIESVIECPNCGENCTLFDTSCPNCGMALSEEGASPAEEKLGDIEPGLDDTLPKDKAFEDALIKDIESAADETVATQEPAVEEKILESLESLEPKDIEGVECPSCGIMVGKDAGECPVCGTKLGGS